MIVSVVFGSVKSFPVVTIVSDLSKPDEFNVIKKVGEFRFVRLVSEKVVHFNGDARFDVAVFTVLSDCEMIVDDVKRFVSLIKSAGNVRVSCPGDFDVNDLKLRFESIKLYSEGLIDSSAGEGDVLNIVEGRVIVNNLLLMSEFGCVSGIDDVVLEFNRLLRKGKFEFLDI